MARSPCFRFYPREFLSDLSVQAMSAAELGYYMKLLAQYWISEGLPADSDELALVLKISRKKFDRVWPRIGLCFTRRGSRLKHKFLDAERKHQDEWRKKSQQGGRKGMASRWGQKRGTDNGGYPVVKPLDNISSSSSSSTATSSSEDRDPGEAGALSGGTGGIARAQEHRPDGRIPFQGTKSSDAGASRSANNGTEKPDSKKLVPLGYELVRLGRRFESDADLKDALKDLAARHGIPYNATSITGAVDALRHAKAPLFAPAARPAARQSS